MKPLPPRPPSDFPSDFLLRWDRICPDTPASRRPLKSTPTGKTGGNFLSGRRATGPLIRIHRHPNGCRGALLWSGIGKLTCTCTCTLRLPDSIRHRQDSSFHRERIKGSQRGALFSPVHVMPCTVLPRHHRPDPAAPARIPRLCLGCTRAAAEPSVYSQVWA